MAKLFSKLKLRELTLANRIVVSPMGQYSAVQGCATEWHLAHLGHLAFSGAGLLITEATAVEPNGRLSQGDLGLYSDECEVALRRVVDFCRSSGGSPIGIQLYHGGRKSSITTAWEGQKAISIENGGWINYSSSAIAYPGRQPPTPLDRAGIERVVTAFGQAAHRAHNAGLDLIEIHAAHGYLIHNFLSPLVNDREDDYGGSIGNRMRFLLEVFDKVRSSFPRHKPVGVRISATDWAEGGWTLDDSVTLAKVLKERGCDYVTASSGGSVAHQQLKVSPGYQVPFAETIRRETGMTSMAVGLITEPRQAEKIIECGQADLVALGRGMLYNPRWPWHAAMELGETCFYPKQYERAHPRMRSGDFLRPRMD